jgi:small lipoprotein (TIGR04454 family)
MPRLFRSLRSKPFSPLLGGLVLAAGMTAGAGCGRPSQEDCQKAVDHLMDLIQSAAPPESDDVKKALQANFTDQRNQFIDECKSQGTKKDTDCILGAKSLDDLMNNCGQASAPSQ